MKSSFLYVGGILAFTASAALADTVAASDPSNSTNNATNTVTSADQSDSQSDVAITAAIRRHLVRNSHLSTDAKNVKIVTSGGKVMLLGPVDSDQEKKTVFSYAAKVVGDTHVDNQLTVK